VGTAVHLDALGHIMGVKNYAIARSEHEDPVSIPCKCMLKAADKN